MVVDDEKVTDIPNRKNESGTYYSVKADCGESTKAEWDYNAWNLKVDNIKSNSKCSLTFTSNLSESDYKKYIEAGVVLRRNTYRGKDITEYLKLEESNPMNLYNQISRGTFDDIYVGDYIVSKTLDAKGNQIEWLIADLDNYYNQGRTGDTLTKHHATIIPAYFLEIAKMNTNATTEGGYAGSEMVTKILGDKLEQDNTTILGKYIYPDFENHVLKYENQLSNAMDSTWINKTGEIKVNPDGSISGTGASSSSDWYYRYLDLMSEVNVFGSAVLSSSLQDIGLDHQQYAIFKLKPELICQDLKGNKYWYWLSTVVNSTSFGTATRSCTLFPVKASYDESEMTGIRPRFLID